MLLVGAGENQAGTGWVHTRSVQGTSAGPVGSKTITESSAWCGQAWACVGALSREAA